MPDAPIAPITTLSEFQARVDALRRNGGHWIFRGHANVEWKLETSLERAFTKTPPEGTLTRREAETIMVREFRRHYDRKHYPDPPLDTPPEESDTLEWLALMQHYGTPTRLLDWTWSEYVALFFAVLESSQDRECEVLAINQSIPWARFTKYLSRVKPSMFKRLRRNDKDPVAWNKILATEWKKPMVAPVNPFRMECRRRAQQSTFLVPLAMNRSFKQNFAMAGPCERIAIATTPSVVYSLLMSLRRSGTTPLSLFPDPGGLAKSAWHTAMLKELRPKIVTN